jgi:hypothetical protein
MRYTYHDKSSFGPSMFIQVYLKVELCVSKETHTWILNQSLHSAILLKHCNFLNSSKSRKHMKLCVKVIIQVTLHAIFNF